MGEHPWIRPWRSVRVRVAALATVVVAVALAIAGFALVRAVEHQLLDKLRAQADAQLSTVAQQLASGVPPDKAVQPPTTNLAIGVMSASGQPVAGPPLPIGGGQSVVVTSGVEPGERGGGVVTSGGGYGLSTGPSSIDIRYEGVATPNGIFTVVAASPLSGVEESITTLEHTLWLALPGVLAVVAAISWLVAGRALRPVDAIRAEVDEITATTIHRRVPEPATGDEVARLARTMNAMLDRLEAASRRQREFVSDASHELRSPVASMRTQLEIALASSTDARWADVATSVLEDEARLEKLIADLLALATLDEGTPPRSVAVDMGALVHEEAARARDVAVEADVGIGATVVGNPSLLARVLANLLDNAARYARGRVLVALSVDGEAVTITVDDDGPGIAPADRDRIFERFTRLDTARTRDGRQDGGAGLGLALVRAIVERHHGVVVADASPLGGARFVVRLPVPTREREVSRR